MLDGGISRSKGGGQQDCIYWGGRSAGAEAFEGLGLLLRVVRDLGETRFAYRSAGPENLPWVQAADILGTLAAPASTLAQRASSTCLRHGWI